MGATDVTPPDYHIKLTVRPAAYAERSPARSGLKGLAC
jgi:hypothetical protein